MARSTSSSHDLHRRSEASDPRAGPERPLKAAPRKHRDDTATAASPRGASTRDVAATDRAASVATQLLLADDAAAATCAAVDLVFEGTRTPVAAWRVSRGDPAELICVRGLGAPRRRRLGSVGFASAVDEDVAQTRARVERRFRAVAGGLTVSSADADDVVLMIADAEDDARRLLTDVATLLGRTIEHLAEVQRAEQRNHSLERGIALTAHEIRSPLVGVRAALDSLIGIGGRPATRSDLLSRSRDEVANLVDATESILRFAVDVDRLRRRKVDLSLIARDAARSSTLGAPSPRIRLHLTPGVMVSADALQLKLAIANVLRNALAYSPRGSQVTLTVGMQSGAPTVEVRDRGPGVGAEDRDAIFDPFVRGGTHVRGGRGLGLFIAKRVVEAHGGSISVSSRRPCTTFRIELPTGRSRERP